MIGGGGNAFGVALGGVACSFRKEINPFEKFEMWSRVLSWDRKWVYIVTHFVRKDTVRPRHFSMYPKQKNENGGMRHVANKEDAVIASAISKIVFKKGRLTIPPEVMLQASGLLPPRPEGEALLQSQALPAPRKRQIAQEIFDVPFRAFENLDLLWEAIRNSMSPAPENGRLASREGSPDGTENDKAAVWTWARVEEERAKGMELAQKLGGLDGLAGKFTAEEDALGKHSDLWWFLGITY